MNTESQVLNVPIEDIIPNRFQPRINFDENALQELASSIKEHGIIQPLVLRRIGEKFEIIAGERRYKASKLAGLTSVPAIITVMDDKKSAEVAIVENIQRKDLTAIEEAKSYKSLLDKGYLTQEELAKKMGISQSAVANKLRLLSLSENVQQALMEGKISERHARSLLKLKTNEEQDKWLKIIIDERLTVRALDNRLKDEMKENESQEFTIKTIDNVPTIEEIKNQAEDINLVKNNEQNIDFNSKPKIPNKFFNFLEDEQANMNMNEDIVPVPVVEDIPTSSEPVITPPMGFKEEEIEVLDFEPPMNTSDINNKEEIKGLINNFENELKLKNYKVNLIEENGKYIITIEK